MEEVKETYRMFVVPMTPVGDENVSSIILRFEIKRLYYATDRLIHALEHFSDDPVAYQRWLHIPHKSLYHHAPTGLKIVGDVNHAIFSRGFYEHVSKLVPRGRRPRPDDVGWTKTVDPNDYGPFSEMCYPELKDVPISINRAMNDILEYCAQMSSYTVLPPDVVGFVYPTMLDVIKFKESGFMEPGNDNRVRVTNEACPRPCISCKLTHIMLGYTDTIEQAKRARCNCAVVETKNGDDALYNHPVNLGYYDASLTARASLRTRMAVLSMNRDERLREVGCQMCPTHAGVLKKYMITFKSACDGARLAMK